MARLCSVIATTAILSVAAVAIAAVPGGRSTPRPAGPMGGPGGYCVPTAGVPVGHICILVG
jgi:hypothetical protein